MPAQEPFFISQQSGDTLTPLPEAMPDLPTTAVADALASVSRAARNARIAVYDDMLSEPRVVDIVYTDPLDYIEKITNEAYSRAKALGGSIPYTVIRELAENFIHAGFKDCTVSILDKGNTLCFSDQGPGIALKDQVLRPGFTSATQEMKRYIRGVGSGLPVVSEYLGMTGGLLAIEDNAIHGTVITISARPASEAGLHAFGDGQPPQTHPPALQRTQAGAPPQQQPANQPTSSPQPQAPPWPQPAADPLWPSGLQAPAAPMAASDTARAAASAAIPTAATPMTAPNAAAAAPAQHRPAAAGAPTQLRPAPYWSLNERELAALQLLHQEGMLGSGELAALLNTSPPTATRLLQRLEQLGLAEVTIRKKRILTNAGMDYLQSRQ